MTSIRALVWFGVLALVVQAAVPKGVEGAGVGRSLQIFGLFNFRFNGGSSGGPNGGRGRGGGGGRDADDGGGGSGGGRSDTLSQPLITGLFNALPKIDNGDSSGDDSSEEDE